MGIDDASTPDPDWQEWEDPDSSILAWTYGLIKIDDESTREAWKFVRQLGVEARSVDLVRGTITFPDENDVPQEMTLDDEVMGAIPYAATFVVASTSD